MGVRKESTRAPYLDLIEDLLQVTQQYVAVFVSTECAHRVSSVHKALVRLPVPNEFTAVQDARDWVYVRMEGSIEQLNRRRFSRVGCRKIHAKINHGALVGTRSHEQYTGPAWTESAPALRDQEGTVQAVERRENVDARRDKPGDVLVLDKDVLLLEEGDEGWPEREHAP